MTPEQAEQWIKEVAGRKIRLSSWSKKRYIIPTGKWRDKSYKYTYFWTFEYIDQDNEKGRHIICEGLSKDKDGYCWEYVENFELYLEMLDL